MKTRRRLKIRYSRLVILIGLIALVIGSIWTTYSFVIDNDHHGGMEYDFKKPLTLSLDLNSQHYLIFRTDTKTDYFAYEADEVIYPASVTKLMTLDAILALNPDLTSEVVMQTEDYALMYSRNASVANLGVGYKYTIEDLLYAMILSSGADACAALERYFENQGINLVEQLNQRAMDLGMDQSHFVNVTGLFEEEQVTSLNDLKKLVLDLWQYPQAKAILSSMAYESNNRTFYSTLNAYGVDDVGEAHVLGGKTGYTYQSKQNIVVFYEVEDHIYCMMLAEADGNPVDGEYFHADDCIDILSYLYDFLVE